MYTMLLAVSILVNGRAASFSSLNNDKKVVNSDWWLGKLLCSIGKNQACHSTDPTSRATFRGVHGLFAQALFGIDTRTLCNSI